MTVCDYCNDESNEELYGGIIFNSTVACPKCAVTMTEFALRLNLSADIIPMNPDERFKDNVAREFYHSNIEASLCQSLGY